MAKLVTIYIRKVILHIKFDIFSALSFVGHMATWLHGHSIFTLATVGGLKAAFLCPAHTAESNDKGPSIFQSVPLNVHWTSGVGGGGVGSKKKSSFGRLCGAFWAKTDKMTHSF